MTQTPISPKDKQKEERRGLIFGQRGPNFSDNRAEKMGRAVKDLDRKFEEEETGRKAKQFGLPYFNLYGFPVDQTAITAFTQAQADEARAIAFYHDGNHLKVGIVDPSNPRLEELQQGLEKRRYLVDTYLISKSGFEAAMKNYRIIKSAAPAAVQQIKITTDSPAALRRLGDLQEMGSAVAKVSATELITILLAAAKAMRASDVHIQPEKSTVSVRYRVDGVLQEAVSLGYEAFKPLVSRIKILSKLKLNVTKVPQDGSFVANAAGQDLEIRVSILPSALGEAIVMRLLGSQESVEIDQLGLTGLAFTRVEEEINKPNGMILTTGPTGSGKTTTLYSFLKRVNKPGVKIITLENPIEYRLEGVEQIQIDDRKGGLTFANALRSVLRQDPDIIMVGEIRDYDTVDTAAQAALTGHMVYSTLHTNDAAGAIPRMLHLGVKPVTLAPALSVVIAQRLVRRLCPKCKQEEKLDDKLLARVKSILTALPKAAEVQLPKDWKFFHGHGCAECNNLGYRGRIGVYEVIIVDDSIEQLIFKEASTVDIKNQAIKTGMITMAQDGLLKALAGITDVAEVFRVTEE